MAGVAMEVASSAAMPEAGKREGKEMTLKHRGRQAGEIPRAPALRRRFVDKFDPGGARESPPIDLTCD